MALSFYSNWPPAMDQYLPADLHHQQDAKLEPLGIAELPADPILEALGDCFSDEADSSCLLHAHLPSSLSDPSVLSLPQAAFPTIPDPHDQFHHRPYAKRARSCNDLYLPTDSVFGPEDAAFDVPVNGFPAVDHPGCFLPLPRATSAAGEYSSGSSGERKPSLSAQSVAARERRKRISSKTQELGRLIPGGNKMNTAEMFQAAHCYVKFLQAQVGLLGLLAANEAPSEVSPGDGEGRQQLHVLLTSTAVQEKLYRAEKCMVPKRLLEDLMEDRTVKSHPVISRDVGRLLENAGNREPPVKD